MFQTSGLDWPGKSSAFSYLWTVNQKVVESTSVLRLSTQEEVRVTTDFPIGQMILPSR